MRAAGRVGHLRPTTMNWAKLFADMMDDPRASKGDDVCGGGCEGWRLVPEEKQAVRGSAYHRL